MLQDCVFFLLHGVDANSNCWGFMIFQGNKARKAKTKNLKSEMCYDVRQNREVDSLKISATLDDK